MRFSAVGLLSREVGAGSKTSRQYFQLSYSLLALNFSAFQRRPTLPCIVEEDLVLEDLDLDEDQGKHDWHYTEVKTLSTKKKLNIFKKISHNSIIHKQLQKIIIIVVLYVAVANGMLKSSKQGQGLFCTSEVKSRNIDRPRLTCKEN